MGIILVTELVIRLESDCLKTLLLQKQQALSNDFEADEYIRLFNHTQAQLKASVKKLARTKNTRVQEVYLISHFADSGAGVWEQIQ